MNKYIRAINKLIIDYTDDYAERPREEEVVVPRISVYDLAELIMRYAHRNQKRENGENYANHPLRVAGMFRNWFGPCRLELLGISFKGVQEVCLLHDVVEDTKITIDDLYDIFAYYGHKEYFDNYLRKSLEIITHNKEDSYFDYIGNVLENPVASLVKMIDLQDNLFILGLISFDDKKYERAQDYLRWFYVINEKYHFIEKIEKYKKELGEK